MCFSDFECRCWNGESQRKAVFEPGRWLAKLTGRLYTFVDMIRKSKKDGEGWLE